MFSVKVCRNPSKYCFITTTSYFKGNSILNSLQLHWPQGKSPVRCRSDLRLTSSLELISQSPRTLATPLRQRFALEGFSEVNSSKGAVNVNDRISHPSLCIVLGWLMSEKKHIVKHVDYYLGQGFDILVVNCSVWKLLWPATGTRAIARDILAFMESNQKYGHTICHGFCVGSLVWGQLLCEMEEDPGKHAYMHRMVVGQIWDSMGHIESLLTAFGSSVFPNNRILRKLLDVFIKFHLHVFEDSVKKPLEQTEISVQRNVIRTPCLFFCSKDDPFSQYDYVQKIVEHWRRHGSTVRVKCWEKSIHASHISLHPEEYKLEVREFLNNIGLLKYPEKFGAQPTAPN